MEGDLLRSLVSGLPDEEVEGMREKLRWGLALYTPVEVAAPSSGTEERVSPGRGRRGSPRRSRR